jgi:hypothetical protein
MKFSPTEVVSLTKTEMLSWTGKYYSINSLPCHSFFNLLRVYITDVSHHPPAGDIYMFNLTAVFLHITLLIAVPGT